MPICRTNVGSMGGAGPRAVQPGLRRMFVVLAALLAILVAGTLEWAAWAAQPNEAAVSVRVPNPRLAGLPDGTALDLGPYECESRSPGIRCETIFDYSRFNYDRFNHRMLAFGGGHAATGRTDVDVFDLDSLTWASLYPSMSCDQVAAGDVDSRGFHRKTGHPIARHTYDQTVVVDDGDQGWLMLFSVAAQSGYCHSFKREIKAVAALSLNAANARWEYSKVQPMPWRYAGVAEYDPVSGMVLLISSRSGSLWVYDPRQHRVVASKKGSRRPANSSNLVYDQRGDRMYLIDMKSLQIREYMLNRANWEHTVERIVETTDAPSEGFRNFAYDSRNHVIAGFADGLFHAFDPATRSWSSHVVVEQSATGARLGRVAHHAIDYDPVNNVFILVSGRSGALRTWAYRFRN